MLSSAFFNNINLKKYSKRINNMLILDNMKELR